MAIQRSCDICHMYKRGIETFGLRRQVRREPPKRGWTTTGAGSMDICPDCWEHNAKARMRPWKKDSFKQREGVAIP